MRWVIEYTDGSTFSNEDGNPADAPGGGVLAVSQEDSTVGRLTYSGNDYYIFSEDYGGWMGMDVLGFVQYVMDAGPLIIKLGKGMPTGKFIDVMKRIRSDPRLPKKSAYYRWENQI